MARLSIRIDFSPGKRLGPGKVVLLENIAALGSISAAGRAMDMSYRRAWLLVAELNALFREPLVAAQMGGKKGGGATLTEAGAAVVRHYRALEAAMAGKAGGRLKAVEKLLAKQDREAGKKGASKREALDGASRRRPTTGKGGIKASLRRRSRAGSAL